MNTSQILINLVKLHNHHLDIRPLTEKEILDLIDQTMDLVVHGGEEVKK